MKKSFFIVLITVLFANSQTVFAQTKIRIAHFPNVTHAPALIAHATENYKSQVTDAEVEWKLFSAGPEAIEALFAGAIDILYVGPNPAVNGYVRSNGEAINIIGGVASGGSAFVVRQDSDINQFEDIKGKRVASPQKGNTQDVALRYLMAQKNLSSIDKGGDVTIFNLSGGDQITGFLKNQIDAIWTVEPWVSKLVSEANGKVLFEEEMIWPKGKYATTVLVVRKKFAREHPELVIKWLKAHIENIKWIYDHIEEAKNIFNDELKRETGKTLAPDYLDHAFTWINFTDNPMKEEVLEAADRAFKTGYLGKTKPSLDNLYDLSFLNSAKENS